MKDLFSFERHIRLCDIAYPVCIYGIGDLVGDNFEHTLPGGVEHP